MKSKVYVFLVKAIFAIPLVLFGLWLLTMLYTPGVDAQNLGERTAAPHEPNSAQSRIRLQRSSQVWFLLASFLLIMTIMKI